MLRYETINQLATNAYDGALGLLHGMAGPGRSCRGANRPRGLAQYRDVVGSEAVSVVPGDSAARRHSLLDPKALYQIEEFYETLDGELLFGPGVQASDFHDDALGRALLKFHAAHPAQVYADLSARAVATYALPDVDSVHGDTTALTFEGDYVEADAAVEPSPPPSQTDAAASSVQGPVTPALTARPKRGYN